jgi:hypothetical protein
LRNRFDEPIPILDPGLAAVKRSAKDVGHAWVQTAVQLERRLEGRSSLRIGTLNRLVCPGDTDG